MSQDLKKRKLKARRRRILLRDRNKNIDEFIIEEKAKEFLIREAEAKLWIEEMTNTKLPEGTANFVENLRDGYTLCVLAKVFAPNVVTKQPHKVKFGTVMEMLATDNFSTFFKACESINFGKNYWFSIPDIWEMKNIKNVVECIHYLARYLNQIGDYVKIKDLSNTGIEFDEKEIEETKNQLKKLEEEQQQQEQPQQPTDVQEPEDIEEDSEDDIVVADPDQCIIEGIEDLSKAEAGVEIKFTIIAKDSDGVQLKEGGEVFKVFLKHTTDTNIVVNGKVEDLHDGTYKISYTPVKSGDYQLHIFIEDHFEDLDDEENNETFEPHYLKGFPMKVTVEPAKTSDPKQTEVSEFEKNVKAGEEISFTIKGRDAYGNYTTVGGDKMVVTLTHEDGTQVETSVTDNNDGTYSVKTTPTKSGNYSLKIEQNDVQVGDALSLSVSDTGVSDPSKCIVEGIASSLKAGETSSFSIKAIDAHGNKRTQGDEKFVVIAENKTTGNKFEVEVKDEGEGIYTGSITPEQSGDYLIEIKLGETNVNGSPFSMKVSDCGVSDPTKCVVQKEEGFNNPKAGEVKKLTLESRDKFGNVRESGNEEFTPVLTRKETTETLEDRVSISYKELGVYEVTFSAEKAGGYTFELLYNTGDEKVNVAGFPCDIEVSETGETEPTKCILEGDGVEKAILNEKASFTIQTTDKFGNLRAVGGDDVKVSLSNQKTVVNATVVDNNNGKYSVEYVCPQAGDWEMQVVINGVEAKKISTKVAVPDSRRLTQESLSQIQDHDLLESLVNTFNEENFESLTSEIQALREQLVIQIRRNMEGEKNVRDIEKRIELLINQRAEVQEIINHSRGLFRMFFGNRPQPKKTDEKKENVLIKHYSHLFYLLQTEPKYLSKVLFLVPTGQVDKFLETVILTLYGYAFSPREEYLILNLFKRTLKLEVDRDSSKIGSFLNNNPVLPKMVMTYGRRVQGKEYLQKVLYNKILEPIVNNKDLDLVLDAVKLLKEQIQEQEISTGIKSPLKLREINYKRAMQDEQVKKLIMERKEKVAEICTSILQGLTDNVDAIPFGLRYVCKQLDIMLKEKHPNSTEAERASVIGYIIYYRFMNPAIVSPDGFELTKKKITPKMRTNLILISKVLTNLSNNAKFDPNLEEHMIIMNDYIAQSQEPYLQFIRKLISVSDPEDNLGVDEYMELTQKKNPTITITINELYNTHRVLVKYAHKLIEGENDPLNIILKDLGDKIPEDLPAEQNDEIALPLINKFATVEKKEENNADHLYEKTKDNLRNILKMIPVEILGQNLIETLTKAKEHAKKNLESSTDVDNMVKLCDRIEQVTQALPELEKSGKVSSNNNYRQLLVDITLELQNMKAIHQKQQKEYNRLKESLISLQQYHKYLSEKFKDFEDYIKESQKNEFIDSGKKHKFTYKDLERKNVIVDMNVIKSQRNKVKFYIYMPSPGVFAVDAKMANVTVSTIEIKLDDLLSKKARYEETIEYDYVTLNVNMTLHMLNQLFMKKNK